MPSNCEGAESAEVATVLQGDETEGDNNQKNRFLVYMPTKEERCVTTQGNCTNECIPATRVEPDLDQRNLGNCEREPKSVRRGITY